MRAISITLFIAAILTLLVLLIPTKQVPAPVPWQVEMMSDGYPRVLNLHLKNSSYRQAQKQFYDYGDIALFTEPNKKPSLEVYFNSINIAGLSAKIILTLAITKQETASLLDHSQKSLLQASGARKHEVNSQDIVKLLDKPIESLSYIPAVRVDQETVQFRFGKPEKIDFENKEHTKQVWYYSNIGLTVFIRDQEKTVFQFY